MADPNVELLARVATALGDLRERVTFVGGCATALLITDPAAAPVRATQDVDAIVAVVSLADYHRIGGALRERGFAQTLEEGEPPYRWTYAGLKLDLMPTDAAILGFSNRWYEALLRSAVMMEIAGGVAVRVADAPSFLATKLEAFLDRGGGDYLSSHDLEDVLSVVDGRPELVAELGNAAPELRAFVAQTFARLLGDDGFDNALPGLVADGSPAVRTPVVRERLRAIAAMQDKTWAPD
jgi:predicted nucleotidyltransferase